MTIAPTVDAKAPASTQSKQANWWSECDNLPLGAVRCGLNRRFCGSCSAIPPCTLAPPKELKLLDGCANDTGITSIWPCKLCTKEMRIRWSTTDEQVGTDRCCCWEKIPKSRIIEYKKWRAKHERDNILTTERRRVYNKRRIRNSDCLRARSRRLRYKGKRTCKECSCQITDQNTTGYCRRHVWIYKEANNNKTSMA